MDSEAEDYVGNDYMIAWDVGPPCGPRVRVGPWPDRPGGWSHGYQMATGCCDSTYEQLTDKQRAVRLVYLAAGMMFDGVPPADVLQEFAKIRAWREMDALMPGGRYERAFIPGRLDWSPHTPPE